MEILLGKSKTGKSKYIYDCIKKDIVMEKEDILFVPSQTRLETEEEFMDELSLDGIIGVDITTISSFVLEQLKNNNLNFESNKLSKLDKKILLAKTVIENNDIFDMFSKVKLKQGFLDNLYNYIDIFKKENINSKELGKVVLNDEILDKKLKEILNIYDKYNENINQKFVNCVDEIDLFIEKNNCDFKNKKIFFDGYNNFTNSELKFIEYLLKSGADVTISLDTDITSFIDIELGNSQSIFDTTNKTYKKLLKICNQNNISVNNNLFYNNYSKSKESIKYLSDNLFGALNNEEKLKKDESINIYLKNDIYKEVRHIARDISKKVREGARYNDFVIYTTKIEEYENVVKKIFYEYKIPYFLDSKQSILKSRLAEYVVKLLDSLVSDLDYETVINILKLGLNNIEINEISELDNYVCEFNLSKKSLKKELIYNNESSSKHIYDLEFLNNLRLKLLNTFDIQQDLKAEFNVLYIIEKIYNHLLEEGILKNYEALCKRVLEIEGNTYFDEQVWGKLCEIFESIDKIYYDEKITINKFNQIFKTAVLDMYIKSIPSSIDNVKILDINTSKGRPSKYVYFVQVNENIFPKSVNEDIFFSDYELEKLSNKNIEFKESSISKLYMGMYNIYTAISNTLEELNIYVLAMDNSGKSLRPSNIITLIKQIIDIEIIGDISKEKEEYDEYSKEQVFEYLINKIKNKDVIEKEVALYKMFKDIKQYKQVLNYTKNDKNLSDKSIELIYGNSLTTSVSRLELYKKCPFSYLMQYSLKINPKAVYEITSLDTGTFMHDVLEKFSKYLLKNNIFYHEILQYENDLKEEYTKKLNEIIEKELNLSLKKYQGNIKFEILKQKLVNTMKNVVTVISKSFMQSEFVPYGYEIEFKDGSMFAPIEIKLNNNLSMKLIGKIDRVDILESEGTSFVRVVDYKSSGKTLELEDIKEGLSLQLMTYLTAFIENIRKNEEKVVPAACVYFNLSDKLINLSNYTNSEEKMKSEIIKALRMKGLFLKDISILEKMDKKISDTNNRMLDVSKISISKGSKKVLEEKEFENLSIEIKNILKNIGDEMLSGTVHIKPNKKSNYCKYCKYMSICRKDSCV